jgi:hypothetical protein
MLYVNDWDGIKSRYIEYWSRENHDRPLISITAPKDNRPDSYVKAPTTLEDKWLDIEYIISSSREAFASTFYCGEAFPSINPDLGPDILGAMLGCDLVFGENTSWAVHFLHSLDEAKAFSFDPENRWWKKIKEITQACVDDARGDYFVGVTDLHPAIDALVSLRGPENICMDLYDNPSFIKKSVFEILDVFKRSFGELHDITTKNLPGSTNWMGIWHPGRWYPTSCDFICMISGEMLVEFVLPELLKEIEWLDASIFHLDGPGALKHLDTLLDIPRLKGIQWVYGAGQPGASHWISVLKRIQAAGKLIQVAVEPEELDILLNELAPEGVMYVTGCKTEQDARDLMKKVENSYKRKLF